MKKLSFLMMLFVMITGIANAEEGEKHDKILSGNIGFSYESALRTDNVKNGTSTTMFNIGPSFLYGFTEKFYFGGEIFADMYNFRTYTDGDKTSSGYKNMFGLAPTARYYAYKGKMIGIFCNAQIGAAMGRDNDKTIYTSIFASLTPGIEFFLGKHFSLSASISDFLSYEFENANPKGSKAYNTNDFEFVFNPMEMNYAPLQLTLSYHFR